MNSPEFCSGNVRAGVEAESGLVLLNRYRAGATTLCAIPIDRIGPVEVASNVDSVLIWAGPAMLPVSTARGVGTLALEFRNDLNGSSVATFGLGSAPLASALKNDIAYAIYDWQRGIANGQLEST
ncbi:MAG: hypothetical protein K0R39_2622 [Symbiobacteriaceae bacterium]|jgi:hypothetical protein|nr:hypothetical protein [Symbiobacteriaceae bacterium]